MADAIIPDAVIRADNFIKKSERNVTPANDDGRVPQLEADGFLHSEFLKNILSFKTRETFDGSTTPVPVILGSDNYLLQADANVVGLQDFYGFVREATTGKKATFLNGQQYTTPTSQSHTVNAGTDRLVLIIINMALVGTTVTASGVTWNGNACTKLMSDHGSRAGMDVWYYAAGTNGSNQTGNIVITGATGQVSVFADNYEYVNQASPFDSNQIVAATSGLTITKSLTLTQSSSTVFEYHCDRNGNAITMDTQLTVRYTEGTSRKSSDGSLYGARTITLVSSTVTTSYTATDRGVACAFALKHSTTNDDTVEVWHREIVPGFSGKTVGATQYVADAVGTITETAPAVPIRVGIAVSATQIFIEKPGGRTASGVLSVTSGGSKVVFCGFMPKLVRVVATVSGGSNIISHGVWTPFGGNQEQRYGDNNSSGITTIQDGSLWNTSRLAGGATNTNGTLTAVSRSGFTLNVNYTGGTTLLLWEAIE